MVARARAESGLEQVETQEREESSRPKPKPASQTDDAAPSPALILQKHVHGLDASEPRKWPPAVTLGFIVVTCGAFWALVALGIGAALK